MWENFLIDNWRERLHSYKLSYLNSFGLFYDILDAVEMKIDEVGDVEFCRSHDDQAVQ
jgi:hypothetical protein